VKTLYGVTDAQIGRAIDTAEYFVQRWHNGETMPTLAQLAQRCRYYGVSADYLLGLTTHLPFDMRQQLLNGRIDATFI